MRVVVLASLVLAALGCAQTDEHRFHSLASSGGGSGNGAGGNGDLGIITGPGCGPAATLIYVLSNANELFSFRPDLKLFTMIGTLSCPTSMKPNSMAIDRHANAWVNFVSHGASSDTAGAIFKVSTSDASCSSTSLPLPAGWFRLGMGFSTDAMGGTQETLFVAGVGSPGLGAGLGHLDLSKGVLTPVGSFTGALKGQDAELTGDANARLFGFFTTTPVQVAQIDKASGATASPTPLPQVEVPADWAFSFWGGDFYLYTRPASPSSRTTNVTRYRPSDGTTDPAYMTDIGFVIVGAGVSTCAPVVNPK